MSNNNQDSNYDHRAGGRTHISQAMFPIGGRITQVLKRGMIESPEVSSP